MVLLVVAHFYKFLRSLIERGGRFACSTFDRCFMPLDSSVWCLFNLVVSCWRCASFPSKLTQASRRFWISNKRHLPGASLYPEKTRNSCRLKVLRSPL